MRRSTIVVFSFIVSACLASIPAVLCQNLYVEWNRSSPSGWDVSPRVHDLTLDRKDEILGIASGNPPVLMCFSYDGTPSWQAPLQGSRGVGVALGYLDGDSKLEVVAASSERSGSRLYAFDTDGREMWSLDLEGRCTAPPLVFDLDWNGRDEVLIVDEGRGLICLNGLSGEILWVVRKRMPNDNFVCVADIERVGKIDVLWFQNKTESLWIIDSKGQIKKTLNGTSEQSYFGWPALGDVEADGQLDLVISTRENVICLNPSTLATKWTSNTPSRYPSAMGDVDGDGYLEILVPGDSLVTCLDWNGATRYAVKIDNPGWVGAIAIGDVEGDGKQNAVFPVGGTHIIYVMDAATGFLSTTYSSELGGTFDGRSSVALADGDWDGVIEVYVGTTGDQPSPFYSLSSQERGTVALEWPQLFHDWRATGNYETTMKTVAEAYAVLVVIVLLATFARSR